MTTAAARLVQLSGLGGVSAAVHWRAMPGAVGSTAGAMLVARSGLPTATAGVHLLADGLTSNDWLIRFRRRNRR